MMNLRKMLIAVSFLLASVCMWAQSRSVSGTVVGSDGLPIPGAVVMVKGTTVGAVTDVDGKYHINVPDGSETLIFRIIGMVDQEQQINGRSEVNATMEADTEELNEVMVVAFGTTKKEAFTGSASVVRAEELSKKTTTSVSDALVGSVAGLQMRGASGQPGSNGKIHIRGIASLYADTDPLVIVDGAPYSASLSNIPPEDIESVSVLKDAASAALYGARGAAGVIIVTTKRGKAGDAQINLEAKWGGNTRAIQDYETINDPGKYYELAYNKYYNYYYYGLGQSATVANANANTKMIDELGYQVYTVPKGEQLIGLDGKLNSGASLGYKETTKDGETYYYTPDDWSDTAYRRSFRQEYTLSINGGTEKGAYYMSLGYLNDDGIIEHSSYERATARLKADYQAKSWLRVGANIGYVHSNTKSNPNLDSSALGSTNLMYYTSMIAPIYPIYVRVLDENNNPVIRTDENGNPQYDYGRPGTDYPAARAFLQTGNPLGSNLYNEVVTIGNQLNGTFNADIDFTPWLRFNATSNVNWGSSQVSDYENALYGPKVSVNGEITKESSTTLRTNNTQTLTYYDTFADVHNVNLLLGHEYYDTKTKYLGAVAQGMFSSDVKEINAAANRQVNSNSYTNEYNVEGIFSSLQYNYNEKYYLSGSYRRDASSRFAKENRWGNFWSVGAAWIVNKESFFPETDWVDLLKVKASVGQQGNDNLPNSYYWIDTYNLSASSTTTMSPSLRNKGNKDITWETSTNMNIGTEFTLFGGRLTGSLDFYDKKTTDLLFWLSVPESTGTRGYYGNLGDISNKGLELVLSGSVFKTNDIDINISFNASHGKTTIDKLPESKTKQYGGFAETNNNIQLWYEEGCEHYRPFLYSYAGVNEKGEALYYYDEDLSPAGGHANVTTNNTAKAGKKRSGTTTNIDEASRYAFDSTLPKVFGGFSLSANIYGFDLSATFDYQLGGKVYDSQYRNLMDGTFDSGYAVHKDILNSWTPNNTSSDIPRQFFGDSYTTASSDRWLTDASYLNFQSFTVGYTLPQDLVKRFYLSKVRFFCAGENLQFWSARQGLDPRYDFEGNESIAQYSPARTIMGGVQVSF